MSKRQIIRALKISRRKEEFDFLFQIEMRSYGVMVPSKRFALNSGYGKFTRKTAW